MTLHNTAKGLTHHSMVLIDRIYRKVRYSMAIKKIEAIVRPEKYQEVIDALNAMNVHGITVSQVMGCGHQKGYKKRVRGVDVEITMLDKIKFEVVVSTDEWAEKAIEVIRDAACTGNMGDGKIFVSTLDDVVRIRTGERGMKAI